MARDWLFTAGRYAAMSGDLATEYWIAMAQAMVMPPRSVPPGATTRHGGTSRRVQFGAGRRALPIGLTGRSRRG